MLNNSRPAASAALRALLSGLSTSGANAHRAPVAAFAQSFSNQPSSRQLGESNGAMPGLDPFTKSLQSKTERQLFELLEKNRAAAAAQAKDEGQEEEEQEESEVRAAHCGVVTVSRCTKGVVCGVR